MTQLIKRPFDKGVIMHMLIDLDNTQTIHEKSMYGVFDVLSDVGGLFDIFVILFALFIGRYNGSLYLYDSIKTLYEIN